MPDLTELVGKDHTRAKMRQGVVTAVAGDGTISVSIGGAPAVSGVKCLSPYPPLVNDVVWLLIQDQQALVLGTLGPGSQWTAYTPTFPSGAVTLGNGLLEGRYQKIGKTVHCHGFFKAGTTTTFAGTGWQISLPVPVHGWSDTSGTTGIIMAYNGNYWVCAADIVLNSGTPYFVPFANNTGGFTNVIPFTWANTNQMRWALAYEAA